MKYQKKPATIEAVQLTWQTWDEVCNLLDGVISEKNPSRMVETFSDGCGEEGPFMELTIPKLDSDLIVRHGDWIIKGANGWLWSCEPGIFEATYEPAE